MSASLNTIKNNLGTFASYHLQLSRFQFSFFENFDQFSEADITFPVMFCVPQDVQMLEGVNSYTIRVYIVDLLQSDRSNEQDIINDTLLIHRDLRNWLAIADNNLNVLNSPIAIPLNNFLVTNTIGWYADYEIEAKAENNECSIPFSSNFLLSGNSCSYTFVAPYLTCETLSGCSTILGIQNDITNIYNILSGGTGNDFWSSGATGIFNTYPGNVGVNVQLPQASLHVSGTSLFQNGILRFENTNALAELLNLPFNGEVATNGVRDVVNGISDLGGSVIGTMFNKDAGQNTNYYQIGVDDTRAVIEYLTEIGGTHNAIVVDNLGIRVDSTTDDGSTYVMKWTNSGGTDLLIIDSLGLADYPQGNRLLTYDGNNVLRSIALSNVLSGASTVTGVTWIPNTLTVSQSDGSSFNTVITAFTQFNYSDGSQQNGRILTTDDNGNATWQAPAVGTSLIYFFTNLSAGTSNYYQAKTIIQDQSIEIITNNNVVNNQLLAGFISDPGSPGVSFIPAGIVGMHIHAANTNSGKATQLYFELFKRTTGGTETLLGISNVTPTLGAAQSEYQTELSISGTVLNTTDRIVTKVYANVTGNGTAPNIALYLADNTLSRIQIPTPVLSFQNYVPYTGATANVNLGSFNLTAGVISATTYQGLPIYQRLNDNDTVNFFNYCGQALSGTSQSSPTWNISRISWSSSTPVIQSAYGAWTGRTTLTYI